MALWIGDLFYVTVRFDLYDSWTSHDIPGILQFDIPTKRVFRQGKLPPKFEVRRWADHRGVYRSNLGSLLFTALRGSKSLNFDTSTWFRKRYNMIDDMMSEWIYDNAEHGLTRDRINHCHIHHQIGGVARGNGESKFVQESCW